MADDADPKKEQEGKAYDTIERDFQEVRVGSGGWRRHPPLASLQAVTGNLVWDDPASP